VRQQRDVVKTPVAFLMLSFLTAGCSTADWHWYRPDRTLEEVRTDYEECQRSANQEAIAAVSEEYVGRTRSPTRSPGSYDAAREDSVLNDPLDSWSAWRTPYARNLVAGCMKQKGYQQVPPHRLPAGTRTRKFHFGAIAGR
jgi:hypothetical protein